MNNDLIKMKPVVYEDNKVFCLTPEHKLENWIKIIQETALSGNKVKLYSDIESTGFAFWNRGRAEYDKNLDEKAYRKDAENFFVEISCLKNKIKTIDLKNPYCASKYFDFKSPSSAALIILGEEIFKKYNISYQDYIEKLNNHNLKELDEALKGLNPNLINELSTNAKSEINKLKRLSFEILRAEANDLVGKVDRMIEYAFVACYENEDGEVYLLKDEDDDLIYFHEFVYPCEDGKIPDEKVINESMPLIPYIIHKTDFDFLRGEKEHPFLKIKLNKKAPTAGDVFRFLLNIFDYKGTKEEETKLTDNIIMYFHNGNGFDVPFIDEELNRFFEDKKLRDFVQVYDTLKLVKELVPSDVQKFISACQSNKNFGGDENIKMDEDKFIKPTSKSLDNVKRLASFLINFDPNKPKRIYEKSQLKFFNMFKDHFESISVDWSKFENMNEYMTTNNPDINLIKGFPKPKKTDIHYSDLLNRYLKYLEGRKEYVKSLNNVKKYDLIYKNINNIQENINKNDFLKDALYRLNNTDRSAHGARVDSQLFMDAFIVLENSLYLKPKMSKTTRKIDEKDLILEEDFINILNNLLEGE